MLSLILNLSYAKLCDKFIARYSQCHQRKALEMYHVLALRNPSKKERDHDTQLEYFYVVVGTKGKGQIWGCQSGERIQHNTRKYSIKRQILDDSFVKTVV